MEQQPSLRIVSQSQYKFFNNRLRVMGERNLNVDPETGIARATIVAALQAVVYDELPLRAGMPAPVKGKPLKVEAIRVGGKTACYVVRGSKPIFFVTSEAVYAKIHEAMPDVPRSHCMTLAEARSFMALEDDTVKSLKEAAEYWASATPEEVTQQPKAQPIVRLKPLPKPWDACPDCGGHHDDDDEVFQ
jgi:hypothetical protein